jgi:hypothetical protein
MKHRRHTEATAKSKFRKVESRIRATKTHLPCSLMRSRILNIPLTECIRSIETTGAGGCRVWSVGCDLIQATTHVDIHRLVGVRHVHGRTFRVGREL